ncbi:hydrogenase expression/formation protein [Acidithiobacillus ferrooxidans]|jgi:hydrogenase-1 operon protein HyaF|uniref:Hydrogenase expression protein, putative n=2 Tax=Acidithiobacillus ferrooxidans TaxID=920 RepID=B7JBG0_ACIF2|nr:hydrogenase expression/formation protein [Acidithiobacillus ferrooxidans]ACK79319.1 hydrogenase expression protein, putative [Acidithiobacillus ferrooxidans ATCC 23270]MBU2774555.1 hydrogenase expression/formation protein [Acidithiobacillus ferrooxidans]MBU2818017.1 hydrogenase expression/formation protein [Acidithiobacillus ferrooxidans]MBU2825773.1 hydrogenase expression/formation protein [Acidithiobacillus ferrooxidans]MCR0969839.1 hydrogenase expression/formation protein [Acidithiobacil
MLDIIPIHPAPSPAANAPALLQEIAAALDVLLLSGRRHCIDLGSLPLSPADRDLLRETLGTGEIRMELEALGNSRIEETGVPGVWWVRHSSEDGILLTESLEVCHVPEIVPADTTDIAIGLRRLRQRIAVPESGGH